MSTMKRKSKKREGEKHPKKKKRIIQEEQAEEDISGLENDTEALTKNITSNKESASDDDETSNSNNVVNKESETMSEENNTLIVFNISRNAQEESYQEHFDGAVSLQLARSADGGCKGFGFVEYGTVSEARDALSKLNDSVIDGIKVKVEFAKKRKFTPQNLPASKQHGTTEKQDYQGASQKSKTLYITNLSFNTTKEDLQDMFCNSTSVRILTDSSGNSKGYAYVEFECSEESTAAMSERNEQELNGQPMNIEYFIMSKRDSASRKSGAENPSKTLYVGNLSEYTTEQSLKDSFGNAISARMPTNHATGGHRGFGFVTFNSIEDATTAKGTYHGQYLDGRKVMIRYETKSTINTKVSLAERTNRVVNDSKKFTRDSNQEPTTKLMIRNLSFKTTDESLQKLFKNAASTHIAMDGKTGQSRGFAFVDFDNISDATAACADAEGRKIDGRVIRASFASEKSAHSGNQNTNIGPRNKLKKSTGKKTTFD